MSEKQKVFTVLDRPLFSLVSALDSPALRAQVEAMRYVLPFVEILNCRGASLHQGV